MVDVNMKKIVSLTLVTAVMSSLYGCNSEHSMLEGMVL